MPSGQLAGRHRQTIAAVDQRQPTAVNHVAVLVANVIEQPLSVSPSVNPIWIEFGALVSTTPACGVLATR